jgi:hypothetical protein
VKPEPGALPKRAETTAGPRRSRPRALAGRPAFLALVAAVGLAATGATPAAVPGIPAIYVTYNADCTFTISVDGGVSITSSTAPGPTLPPGVYQLLVFMPNPNQGYSCVKPTFTLTGPGVASTTVFQGQELHDEHVLPALQPSSTYVAQDASAPTATQRVFTTAASGSNSVLLPSGPPDNGSGASTQPGLVGSAIGSAPARLLATVDAAGAATLRLGGKEVRTLKAGRYELRVDDASPHAGFVLERSGGTTLTLTTRAFVGRRTMPVTLTTGSWAFSTTVGRPTPFTVVA